MARFKNPLMWLHGLASAIVGGGATSGGAWLGMAAAKQSGMDVPALNLAALGVIFASGAITNTLAYLTKSPLPELTNNGDTTFVSK